MHLNIPENPTILYSDRKLLRSDHPISPSLAKMVDKLSCSMYTTGCITGDLHQLMQAGGVLITVDVHVLCEAAPIALIVEQCGCVAIDQNGSRISVMAVEDDFTVKVTLVLGTSDGIQNLQLTSNPQSANGADGH